MAIDIERTIAEFPDLLRALAYWLPVHRFHLWQGKAMPTATKTRVAAK
jgi:hypothetical protein